MQNSTRYAMLVLAVVLLSGCGYGELSPKGYEYAKAMYNIASREADAQLDPFCEKLNAARDKGELSAEEADWLLKIADKARQGNWKSAANKARKLMQEQVR